MKYNSGIRRLMRQENLPIFLVLFAMILATYLVELMWVRDGNVSQVAFLKPLNVSNVLLQVSATGILAITRPKVSGGWRIDQAMNPTKAIHNTASTMAARTRMLRMTEDFSALSE